MSVKIPGLMTLVIDKTLVGWDSMFYYDNRKKVNNLAQIVSFINYKGGVGKTTLAVETAATLAREHGFKVLVMDLDPQTNASFLPDERR